MSIRLKQFIISFVLKGLRLIQQTSVGLWSIIIVLLDPLWEISLTLIKPVVLFIYRHYLAAMGYLKRSAFIRNKVILIFGNKYFIHFLIIGLAIVVTTNNVVSAKTDFGPDFGKHSALYTIARPSDEFSEAATVVEYGLPQKQRQQDYYVSTDGSIVANIPVLDPESKAPLTVADQLQLAENTPALISNSVLQTESGIRAGIIDYKIQDGDTISDIANRFGISVNTILWANNLTSKSYIRPGNQLKIPPASGVIHTVASGETLDKIIEKYKGNLDETIKQNDIGSDHVVAVGNQIIVVGGTPPPPPPPPTQSYIASRSSGTSSSASLYRNQAVPNGAITGTKVNWPVGCKTRATTYWGHAGNGRDLPCPTGTPVYAAESGVAYIRNAGGYGGGYGNYIDVDHGGGMTTRYAHLSAFNITSGQRVSRGQVIGFVGSTGRSSGPHLHFEIRFNGSGVDPINYF